MQNKAHLGTWILEIITFCIFIFISESSFCPKGVLKDDQMH